MKCDSYVVGTYKIEEVLKVDNHCDIVKTFNVYKDVSKDAHSKPEWDLIGGNYRSINHVKDFIRIDAEERQND